MPSARWLRCRSTHQRLHIKGQEHFYLEGQVALAKPSEEDGVEVWTSSQHPTEVQHLVASVLDVPFNQVTVQVRRMGGAFGGKESQAAALACVAALAATKTRRAVKYRMRRREDMTRTGKRHDVESNVELGIDESGIIKRPRSSFQRVVATRPIYRRVSLTVPCSTRITLTR